MKKIEVTGPVQEHGGPPVLSEAALEFIARLTREFRHTRRHLLHRRQNRQKDFLAGKLPSFHESSARIRNESWNISAVPKELEDRRVEITGPSADTKMVINAFNSGARVYMSDFEDSQTPTWNNTILGQHNLYSAIRNTLTWKNPEGKIYRLNDKRAVLFVRPRGWHMSEKHILIDGQPAPASLVDFGLYLFNNARYLIDGGSDPYFYLPKLESYQEARLWNDVFCLSQDLLKIRRGTIKATVLIETIPAAFEMDEILFELRDHSAGLNCGRWDYIFSFIKKLGHDPAFLMPDRSSLIMRRPFLDSYAKLLVATCHKRNAHAIGGMSAYIPVRSDPEANEKALEQVREDKWREVSHGTGHDGTWVAHPGLVPVAKEVFDKYLGVTGNQLYLQHPEKETDKYKAKLLEVPVGKITENGIRTNVRIALEYMGSWLNGNGCVPINNLMEDAATAEISRVQLWQWLKHGATLDDGRTFDTFMLHGIFGEELGELYARKDSAPYKYFTPGNIILDLIQADKCPEFMTLPAYEEVVRKEKRNV